MWARLPASPAAITQRTAIQGEPLPDYFVGESRNGHLSACLKRPRKHIGALRGRDASYLAPPAQIRTCGFPAYGSHLGYQRQHAAVCEPKTCVTLTRLGVRRVLSWPAFPSVPALCSTNSAADRSALFTGFTATMAGSDF